MKTGVARQTMTVNEAAACLGLSRNTAYEAVRTGAIPCIRVGRRILVPTHEIETMLGLKFTHSSN